MNWKVRLSVRAKSEFIDAVKYFDSISISISEKFIKQIFDGLNTIEKYLKVKGNFRQFVLQEMPFLIVFTVQQTTGEILIHSIFHTSRNPTKKFFNRPK